LTCDKESIAVIRQTADRHKTEDEMRIFERLRGRDRRLERKLVETIASDLLRRVEQETPVTVITESGSNCCACCAADENARH